jgi:peptide/nickel transport system permease protein
MTVTDIAAQPRIVLAPQPASATRGWFGRLQRHPLAFGGLILLALVTLAALLAPVLAPLDPFEVHAVDRLRPPSARYWLGADTLGRDVLSRLLYGARISLGVGAATVVFCNVVGILVGLLAGFYRRLDNPLMRVMDGFMAFPSILLALGIVAVLGPSVLNTVIALSIVYTPRAARVVRSAVLGIRQADYITAGRAIGLGDFRLVGWHVLPNAMAPIIVQASFIFAHAVIAEASLSFLGVGGSPEVPSWGNMLSEARQYLRRAPSLALFPGVAIMLTVLSLNLLGDGLRDVLDPHMKGREGPGS